MAYISGTSGRGKAEDKAYQAQRAWLLNFGHGLFGAVAFHEMSQVLIEPTLHDLPCAPLHCHQVVILRQRILPVMNMVTLLTGSYHKVFGQTGIVGIAVYQEAPRKPLTYVGLHLAATPTGILVADRQFCELPKEPPGWEKFALSCFAYDGKKVPVISLAHLFSAELRDSLGARAEPA